VGFPRESMTWRALTRVMFVDMSEQSPGWIELEIVSDARKSISAPLLVIARDPGISGRPAILTRFLVLR
jgi:hypothetical protein